MRQTYLKRNGHERYKFFRKSNGPKAELRRRAALERLENQLVEGGKPGKRDAADINEAYLIKLSEDDIKRIKKEITILKQKLSIS